MYEHLLYGNESIPFVLSVSIPQQLHANNSEDVDDDNQNEGQVTQGTEGGRDNGQKDPHCGPAAG